MTKDTMAPIVGRTKISRPTSPADIPRATWRKIGIISARRLASGARQSTPGGNGGARKPPILKVLSVPMLMQAAQTRSVKMDKGMTGAAARFSTASRTANSTTEAAMQTLITGELQPQSLPRFTDSRRKDMKTAITTLPAQSRGASA